MFVYSNKNKENKPFNIVNQKKIYMSEAWLDYHDLTLTTSWCVKKRAFTPLHSD